jgi:hypothetical protein
VSTKPAKPGAKDLNSALAALFDDLGLSPEEAIEAIEASKAERPVKAKQGDGYTGPPPGPARRR